jgi:hypothetical protein
VLNFSILPDDGESGLHHLVVDVGCASFACRLGSVSEGGCVRPWMGYEEGGGRDLSIDEHFIFSTR